MLGDVIWRARSPDHDHMHRLAPLVLCCFLFSCSTQKGSTFHYDGVWSLRAGASSQAQATAALGRDPDLSLASDGRQVLEWERSKRGFMAGMAFDMRKVVLEFDEQGSLLRPVTILGWDRKSPGLHFGLEQALRLDREFESLRVSIPHLADGWGWFGLPVLMLSETADGGTWLRWGNLRNSTEGTAEVYLTFAADGLPLTYRIVFGGGVLFGSAPSSAELQRLAQEHAPLQQVLEATQALPRWIQRNADGSLLVSWSNGYLGGFTQRRLAFDSQGLSVDSSSDRPLDRWPTPVPGQL
ncbi:MAG: hypothetical protein ACI9HE_000556 [Planctomycetota bacterium]|jgi:hypothetical protein